MAFRNNALVIVLLNFVVLVISQNCYEKIQAKDCYPENDPKHGNCAFDIQVQGCTSPMNGTVCNLALGNTLQLSFELTAKKTLREPLVRVELMDSSNDPVVRSDFPLCETPGCTIFAKRITSFEDIKVLSPLPASVTSRKGFLDNYNKLERIRYSLIDKEDRENECCITFNVTMSIY